MTRICTPRRWPQQAMRLCADLTRRGYLLGRDYSVGVYAGRWAVLDLAGCPVVVADDAYTACQWWHTLETGGSEPQCERLPFDASEAERWEDEHRRHQRLWCVMPALEAWLERCRAVQP